MSATPTSTTPATDNEIRQKLAAHAAITLLYHSHGDARGLELAADLEREAHAIWRDAGMQDCPTFNLALLTQEERGKNPHTTPAKETVLLSASAGTHYRVPNSTLFFGQDTYGNHMQALVPFGIEAESVFKSIGDWDGVKPRWIADIYASTVGDLIDYAQSCPDSDSEIRPW